MSLRQFSAGQNNRREVAIMKIPIRFYYDLGPSAALLQRSCRFCYDLCRFDQNFESSRNRRPVEWGVLQPSKLGIFLSSSEVVVNNP